MTRVLAQAIVDDLMPGVLLASMPPQHKYRVTVTGSIYGGADLPKREFDICAVSEHSAAQEGLDRFVREFQGFE